MRPVLPATLHRSLLFSFLVCTYASHSFAVTGTNPASGYPNDYSGSGDWRGTVGKDYFINEEGATVSGHIDMRQGDIDIVENHGTVTGSIYGNYLQGHTVINSGDVDGSIYGSDNPITDYDGGYNTIHNSGTVGDNIYGIHNSAEGSSGSHNTITNSGTADYISGTYNDGENGQGGFNTIRSSGSVLGMEGTVNDASNSSGGSNTLVNSGLVVNDIFGSVNYDDDTSGGSNTLHNSGIAYGLIGSYNFGDRASGGGNLIRNRGENYEIIGSLNEGQESSGGSNTIYNYGSSKEIYGSINDHLDVSGGNNIIYNYGYVEHGIIGSLNYTSTSSGGGNTIYNYGTVELDIIGSVNDISGSSSTGNTIINEGLVLRDIFGNLNEESGATGGNDTIINRGEVHGSIYGEDGDDTVILAGGSYLGGVADGGEGNDTLGFENMGTIDGSLLGTKYINFENLLFSGGNTNLTGTWDLSNGSTTIEKGTLRVNGTLITQQLVILQGALLGGSGTIQSNLINSGTIAPGNSIGTLTVKGNVDFTASSEYKVELSSNGNGDKLHVTGATTIAGGTINVSLRRGLYRDGLGWNILTSQGGVNGSFAALTRGFSSETLHFTRSMGANSVGLTIKRKPFSTFGVTSNQTAIGNSFDSLVPVAQGDVATLITSMDFDMDRAEIQQTLQAVSPERYSALYNAAISSSQMIDRGVERYQADIFLAGYLGKQEEKKSGWNIWGRYLGAKSTRDEAPFFPSHDVTSNGFLFGADTQVGETITLGVSLANSDTKLSWDDMDRKSSINGKHLGVYGDYNTDSFFVNGSLYGGTFNTDASLDRIYPFGLTQTAAHFDSIGVGSRVKVGYKIPLSSILLAPVAALHYSYLEHESYTEQGAQGLNLDIAKSDIHSLQTTLGLRAATIYTTDDWTFLPSVEAGWLHEYEDKGPEVEANFSQQPEASFTVAGVEPITDYGYLDVSLTAGYGEQLSCFVDYGFKIADDSDVHMISLGLSWAF